MTRDFTFLLTPTLRGALNRAWRRERGDLLRATLFGGLGVVSGAALFAVFFYLTWELLDYEEFGDYLVRLGLSWLFLTFLSFVAFSALVSALSTFFLSEDLHLLLVAPVARARLFYSRYVRCVLQSAWMVVAMMVPVLLGVGLARCAPWSFYPLAAIVVVPFLLIPCAAGSIGTLVLVNVFPARRTRDILMLTGLLFAVVIVMVLRMIRPEQLMTVRTLPDISAFFATLQTPVTPLLPSFWVGEALFSALQGDVDWLHLTALWSTGLAFTVLARFAYDRLYWTGWSKAQEARKVRFTHLRPLDVIVARLPFHPASRVLLLKDLKVFLRDTTQWSQLLLLLALALVYVYNFRVLDLDRVPYLGSVVRNAYAFVNLAMASFVLSAVAVRFVFPSVSAEGPAFWLVRSSPVSMRRFLWSKYWTGLVPILALSLTLTALANSFLGVSPFLAILTAAAICALSFSLVGLACGLGASYPRFNAENVTQVAGSYGGVAFMALAVLFILIVVGLIGWPTSVYLWHRVRHVPLSIRELLSMGGCLVLVLVLCGGVLWQSMRRGVQALEDLG